MITILFPREICGMESPQYGEGHLQAWAENNIHAVWIRGDNGRIVCNVMDSCGKIIGPIVGRGQEDDFSIYCGALYGYDLANCRATVGEGHGDPYFLIAENGAALLELWGF